MKIRRITIRRILDSLNFRFYQNLFRRISVFTKNSFRQISIFTEFPVCRYARAAPQRKVLLT